MPSINYLWDPIEDNVIGEFDDDGNLLVEYTTEPELHGDVISQRRDGQTNCFYSDGLGSTTEVTNAAGDTIATRAYDAFGGTTESTGAVSFPYQYLGQKGYYFDSETSTYYIRRRPYNPAIGRFLSADFLSYGGGLSLYSYVRNRPLVAIDPSGMILVFPELDPPGEYRGNLTFEERRLYLERWYLEHAGGILRQLNTICPAAEFGFVSGELVIRNSGVVCPPLVPPRFPRNPRLPDPYLPGAYTLGCTCLCELVRTGIVFTVYLDAGTSSGTDSAGKPNWIWPHNSPPPEVQPSTDFGGPVFADPVPRPKPRPRPYDIHLPVEGTSQLEFGFYGTTIGGVVVAWRIPYWLITAHELCGHAFLHSIGKPSGRGHRGNRPNHDVSVGIGNIIAEQFFVATGIPVPIQPLHDEDPYHGETLAYDPATGVWYRPPDSDTTAYLNPDCGCWKNAK